MESRPRQSVLIAVKDQESCVTVSTLVRGLGLAPEIVCTGAGILVAAEEDLPALVLLAVDLSEPSTYEILRRLRVRCGESLPIAVLAASRDGPRDEIASLMLGADDYFPRPLEPDRFIARIRRLLGRADEPSIPTGVGTTTPNGLTRREQQVLGLLVEGLRSSEIAESLCITKKTAATHIEHILRKLGAHSQAQAVAFALRADTRPEPGPVAARPSNGAPDSSSEVQAAAG